MGATYVFVCNDFIYCRFAFNSAFDCELCRRVIPGLDFGIVLCLPMNKDANANENIGGFIFGNDAGFYAIDDSFSYAGLRGAEHFSA